MKVGIIGAMQSEVKFLLESLDNSEKITINSFAFFTGTLENKQVVILKSGIGKVNAAIGTSLLINNFDIDYIINTGSAGGFIKYLKTGEFIIADKTVQHDVDVTEFGYQIGQLLNTAL